MRKCGQNCGWDTNLETSKSEIAVANLNLKPWILSYNLLSSVNKTVTNSLFPVYLVPLKFSNHNKLPT